MLMKFKKLGAHTNTMSRDQRWHFYFVLGVLQVVPIRSTSAWCVYIYSRVQLLIYHPPPWKFIAQKK